MFAIKNYLDPACNPKLQEHLKQDNLSSAVKLSSGRAYGMKKILELHAKKGYRIETLFAAQNIFDRYLSIIGHWTFCDQLYVQLATVSVLMSAKLEQDTSPSFNRMIGLLSNDEYKCVSKQALIDMEYDIILKFGCDFNFPGPIESMERFLRLMGYHKNKQVDKICREIMKQQIREANFLNYRPSHMAACAVLVAINMHQNC